MKLLAVRNAHIGLGNSSLSARIADLELVRGANATGFRGGLSEKTLVQIALETGIAAGVGRSPTVLDRSSRLSTY